jgi:hypothetical protein
VELRKKTDPPSKAGLFLNRSPLAANGLNRVVRVWLSHQIELVCPQRVCRLYSQSRLADLGVGDSHGGVEQGFVFRVFADVQSADPHDGRGSLDGAKEIDKLL